MVGHGRVLGRVLMGVLIFCVGTARAQVPGLPGAASPAPAKGAEAASKKDGAPKVSTTGGPIKVDPADEEKIAQHDKAIEHTLESLLPEYPGVWSVDATVNKGVVKLDGRVDDDETRNQMDNEAMRVEGVRMVINRLATDDEVSTAPQLVMRKMKAIWDIAAQRWLLALLALAIMMAFSGLARLFNGYSETLLAPFLKNVMLRSVAGSLISTAIVIGGLMFGLSVLNLTHAVLSVLGLAGVVGLAVGFAFKDIAENFIASILLGVRRPFRVGDYVSVAGQTGVIRSLNTRATVLVTLEGNHVRIPNNIIYKEILVNSTASPSLRGTFDVVIPYDASTAAAIEAMTRALREVKGVLSDPPARALVEALEPSGVRLRAYYWVAIQNTDWFLLNSEAKMRVKVALQQAKIIAPASTPEPGPNGESNGKAVAAQAEANLRHDARAADAPRPTLADGQSTPMEHIMKEDETRVSEEGANLLTAAK